MIFCVLRWTWSFVFIFIFVFVFVCIYVLCFCAATDFSVNKDLYYFPPGLQLPPQPLRGLLPVLLLGEQRQDGCEQFA